MRQSCVDGAQKNIEVRPGYAAFGMLIHPYLPMMEGDDIAAQGQTQAPVLLRIFGRLNCQVKCNSVLKKTSKGDFQPRHLRGRRLSLAMKDAICLSPKFSISTDLGQYGALRISSFLIFGFIAQSPCPCVLSFGGLR